VRHVKGKDPTRIVLSPFNGIPNDSYIAKTIINTSTILITTNFDEPPGTDIPELEVLRFPCDHYGMINPELILHELPKHGILSILIEGGAKVLSTFMAANVIDELIVGVAPSVIGRGISPFEHFTPESWVKRPQYIIAGTKRVGSDVVITYRREDNPFSLD